MRDFRKRIKQIAVWTDFMNVVYDPNPKHNFFKTFDEFFAKLRICKDFQLRNGLIPINFLLSGKQSNLFEGDFTKSKQRLFENIRNFFNENGFDLEIENGMCWIKQITLCEQVLLTI